MYAVIILIAGMLYIPSDVQQFTITELLLCVVPTLMVGALINKRITVIHTPKKTLFERNVGRYMRKIIKITIMTLALVALYKKNFTYDIYLIITWYTFHTVFDRQWKKTLHQNMILQYIFVVEEYPELIDKLDSMVLTQLAEIRLLVMKDGCVVPHNEQMVSEIKILTARFVKEIKERQTEDTISNFVMKIDFDKDSSTVFSFFLNSIFLYAFVWYTDLKREEKIIDAKDAHERIPMRELAVRQHEWIENHTLFQEHIEKLCTPRYQRVG